MRTTSRVVGGALGVVGRGAMVEREVGVEWSGFFLSALRACVGAGPGE